MTSALRLLVDAIRAGSLPVEIRGSARLDVSSILAPLRPAHPGREPTEADPASGSLPSIRTAHPDEMPTRAPVHLPLPCVASNPRDLDDHNTSWSRPCFPHGR